MYYLKDTEVTRAQKASGKRRQFYFQRRNPRNGKQTSRSSEIYTRRENAIKAMRSEILEFGIGVGVRASKAKVAQGYYDETAIGMLGAKKPDFVYFKQGK
jgi:hypothetical protein